MVSQNMTVMTAFSVNPTCKNSQIANFSMNSDLDGSECFQGYNFNVIHTNNKKKNSNLELTYRYVFEGSRSELWILKKVEKFSRYK